MQKDVRDWSRQLVQRELEPTLNYRFEKSIRIRKRSDFQRIQRSGRRFRQRDILALVLPSQGDECRYGLTVSRKVGNAVKRNRVKRLLREAIRHERHILDAANACWDVVVIAHQTSVAASAETLRKQVIVIMERIVAQDERNRK